MDNYLKRGKQITCKICQKVFYSHPSNPNGGRTKYCSPECSQKAAIKRANENRSKNNIGSRLGLSSGIIGKINEQVVAIDLVKRGWNVYTAFEDTHPFDILATNNGDMKRIEVKTAHILPSGTRVVVDPKKKLLCVKQFDVLASVDNLENILYEPDLPIIKKGKAV